MSAAPVTTTESEPRGARLTLVQVPKASLSTFGFVIIVAALIAVGLGAVMIVSTSVGAQSSELSALRREATQLGYKAAALESQLQETSSANALALRATGLGMVPNPYPAFINLADGTVTGVPTPVEGNEMPFLTGTLQAPLPTDTAPGAAAATAEPAPETQSELSAAGATDGQQP